ncbi:MAG TPA: spherulation-specific family 4 protein, partial [Pirellulales bacterium]|nr:spherulation-specific family 4 protein [Pirellulales bacterium]
MIAKLDTAGPNRSRRLLPVLALTLVACGIVHQHAAAYPPARLKPVAKIKLFVPTYFYPAGEGLKEWERLISAAQMVPIVAIANPASGPGDQADPNHANIIGRATQAGVTVIGYVGTQYTKKPLAQVKAEVDRWTHLYPAIKGIFFDEQTSEAA